VRLGFALSPKLHVKPANLWEAILLQFFESILQQKGFRRCASCRRWLEETAVMRLDVYSTCSPTCRQRFYRQRKSEAVQLSEQGLKVEEIAKRMGTDEFVVTKWLAPKKGK